MVKRSVVNPPTTISLLYPFNRKIQIGRVLGDVKAFFVTNGIVDKFSQTQAQMDSSRTMTKHPTCRDCYQVQGYPLRQKF
ncbi:hypothetical protein O9992_00325 [Vibrio lentus]|nr:hypothetical protein [Vibrio lentus]